MRLPGFSAEATLRSSGQPEIPYGHAEAPAGSERASEVVPALFYIRVGPGRCAVGEYANGACWYYGIVSC